MLSREQILDTVSSDSDQVVMCSFFTEKQAEAVMIVAEPSAPGWLECRANEGAAGVQRVPFALPGSMLDQSSEFTSCLISGNCMLLNTVSQF